MTTLFDLTYRVARACGIVTEGTAQSGSSSYLVDTYRHEDEDYWNRGTVWITYNPTFVGTAPQGEYAEIANFDSLTARVTFRSALTSDIFSGITYAIANNMLPLGVLIQKVNQALEEIYVPYKDKTTITTALDQTEHGIPIAANLDLREVWLQNDKDDTNDNRWTLVNNWRKEPSAAGVADILILPFQYSSGYKLKLVYVGPHSELRLYSDLLSEHVPIERVVYPAVAECFRYRRRNEQRTDFDDEIKMWDARADEVKMQRNVILPPKRGRVAIIGQYTVNDSETDKVYLK